MLSNGRMIKKMDKAYKHGLMVQSTSVSTKIIKRKDTAPTHGLMAKSKSAGGRMIKSM